MTKRKQSAGVEEQRSLPEGTSKETSETHVFKRFGELLRREAIACRGVGWVDFNWDPVGRGILSTATGGSVRYDDSDLGIACPSLYGCMYCPEVGSPAGHEDCNSFCLLSPLSR